MPLDPGALSSGIEEVASDPPPTSAECAQAWADAVGDFAAGVVPPSTAVSAAVTTLAGALATAFASPAAAAGMESAFTAFGATVGGGMAPAFVATPPPGPVGFATLFAAGHPATHAAAAAGISGIIDTWMRTGTAVPSGGGASAPWS